MKSITAVTLACAAALATFAGTTSFQSSKAKQEPAKAAKAMEKQMPLGVFSVSLAVKDLKASRAFYEKLDFKEVGGKMEQNWIILQNNTTTIGLFQGMFPKNIMTFNPGWDKDQKTLKKFKDVREIQATLKEREIPFVLEADPKSEGVASFMIADPDGNQILFDQHVEKPK